MRGSEFARVRDLLCLTQNELAGILGISARSIRDCESGESPIKRERELVMRMLFDRAFNKTPQYLHGRMFGGYLAQSEWLKTKEPLRHAFLVAHKTGVRMLEINVVDLFHGPVNLTDDPFVIAFSNHEQMMTSMGWQRL